MKIQIHSSINNMSTTGRQVLGDMQDTYTPLVDLLIRESIQNSTDAARAVVGDDCSVLVSYDVKRVQNAKINCLFDLVEDKLNSRFPKEDTCDCLVIRDSGTFGLTGALRKVDVPDGGNLGNLIKLIYDIRKPQENSGAGGAWGLGKTVYYRLGVGMVLYYSRIKEGDSYESRLAACLVEDETSSESLLPVCPTDGRKSGIAWWGKEDGDSNKTIPITDIDEIHQILSNFEISEYTGEETGTTIIVPYLNTDRLMDVTRYLNSNNDEESVNNDTDEAIRDIKNHRQWLMDLSMFIKIAVQRWYYPRLDNIYYTTVNNLRYLRVKVNGRELTYTRMVPIFQLMQALYNRAALKSLPLDYTDFISTRSSQNTDYYFGNSDNNRKYGNDNIVINKYLDDNRVGSVAYAKVDDATLRMLPPDYYADPFKLFDIDPEKEGRALIAYTRKPGMVVWYDKDTKMSSLPIDGKQFIVGHFALNSSANVKCNNGLMKSLEDYIRATETANHRCWNDDDLKLTHNLKRNVTRKVIQAFDVKEQVDVDGTETGLGTILGGILPPRGFGFKSTSVSSQKKQKKSLLPKKSKLKVYQVGNPIYSSNSLTIKYDVNIPANYTTPFAFELSIATEGGTICINELLNSIQLPSSPIEIVEVNLSGMEHCHLDLDTNHYHGNFLNIDLKDLDGTVYRIEVDPHNVAELNFTLDVKLEYTSMDMKPQITIN